MFLITSQNEIFCSVTNDSVINISKLGAELNSLTRRKASSTSIKYCPGSLCQYRARRTRTCHGNRQHVPLPFSTFHGLAGLLPMAIMSTPENSLRKIMCHAFNDLQIIPFKSVQISKTFNAANQGPGWQLHTRLVETLRSCKDIASY